jgi:polyphosphate kinase
MQKYYSYNLELSFWHESRNQILHTLKDHRSPELNKLAFLAILNKALMGKHYLVKSSDLELQDPA